MKANNVFETDETVTNTGIYAKLTAIIRYSRKRSMSQSAHTPEDVLEHMNLAFSKYHIIALPYILKDAEEVFVDKDGQRKIHKILNVEYTFATDDGSSVKWSVIGESIADQAEAWHQALNNAFLIACSHMFFLPILTEKEQEHIAAIARARTMFEELGWNEKEVLMNRTIEELSNEELVQLLHTLEERLNKRKKKDGES